MVSQKRFSRRIVTLLLGCALVSALSACGEGDDSLNNGGAGAPLTVRTDKGKVAGTYKRSVRAFLGIPYAVPPVGKRRWKPPQPARRWAGVRPAKRFADHCPQADTRFGQPSTSEDCLYLNVFAPTDNRTHPVMVWIHGGGFKTGESGEYDPTPLVKKGVVAVTVDYRLGALGFLALPALTAEAPADRASGNYGLLDQQAALRWVQSNIARFGGDPDNVTLFGQSAGGRSVLFQLVSPAAEGLFQKAIVESGSRHSKPSKAGLEQAEERGRAFAEKAGCPGASLACLRGLSVRKILAAGGTGGLLQPKAGTTVLPRPVISALKAGDFKKIPVMEGTTRHEAQLFVPIAFDLPGDPLTAGQYKSLEPQSVRNVYPLDDFASPDLAAAAVETDKLFACPGRDEIRALSVHVPTYAYEFNDPGAPELFIKPDNVSFSFHAPHASEIQYLFDYFDAGDLLANPEKLTGGPLRLSQRMIQYWTQFAKTGNPNPAGGTGAFWPAYKKGNQAYFSLMPGSSKPIKDFAKEHHCSFWSARGG